MVAEHIHGQDLLHQESESLPTFQNVVFTCRFSSSQLAVITA